MEIAKPNGQPSPNQFAKSDSVVEKCGQAPRTSSPNPLQKNQNQPHVQIGCVEGVLTLSAVTVKDNEFHSTNPKFSCLTGFSARS
jgi:hypothetical protein